MKKGCGGDGGGGGGGGGGGVGGAVGGGGGGVWGGEKFPFLQKRKNFALCGGVMGWGKKKT